MLGQVVHSVRAYLAFYSWADLGDSGGSVKAPKIKKVKHYNTLTWLQMLEIPFLGTSLKKIYCARGEDALKLSSSPYLNPLPDDPLQYHNTMIG